MSKEMPDFKTADEREKWIISHADYFTYILRRDRRNYRGEAKTLPLARDGAWRIIEADPTAKVMIYAVAGTHDTFVGVVAKETSDDTTSKHSPLRRKLA